MRTWDRDHIWNDILQRRKILPNGCWIWTGAKIPSGYGSLRICGKSEFVHKVSYWAFYGDPWAVSFGHRMYVCHSCDNPSCFNPEHLFLATPKENALDSILKGRRHARN